MSKHEAIWTIITHDDCLIRNDKCNNECDKCVLDVPFLQLDKALTMAVEALSQPERKHGHWIESGKFDKHDNKYGRHDYVCSECRGVAINFVGGTEDWWCLHKPKFCPYCGAKMDEVSDA